MIQTLNGTCETDTEKQGMTDFYFSADVETDGPIPGPYSLLSFALVCAGTFDGTTFKRSSVRTGNQFYRELQPISEQYQDEALQVNGLDRQKLQRDGQSPSEAMSEAAAWIKRLSGPYRPVLVAYPLSFDWLWLYWYFVNFSDTGSPFSHSQCFDLKTAFAVKSHRPISQSGRSSLLPALLSRAGHNHHALGDAIEQAEIFANLFEWDGTGDERHRY